MNLLLKEWKSNLKSLCLWSFGMITLVGISVLKTVGMSNDGGQSMTELIDKMPKSLQSVFGLGQVDFSTPIGTFTMIFLYISFISAFHAASLGASIFIKEERDKTFEFLYVKGMNRKKILSFKVIISFINLLILNLITLIFSVLIIKITSDTSILSDILPMMFGLFILQSTFFSLALLISFISKKAKLAANISFSMVIICFFMSIFSDYSTKFEVLKYFTPFKYFDGKVILNDGLNILFILICIAIVAFSLLYSFILHNKRDLKC